MSQSASSPAPQPQQPSKTSDRRRFVQAMIAIAALLFIATEALLYYRWATMSEPSSVLLIDAGPSLNGAEIIVDGVKLGEPLRATIGLNDRYSIPFYLDEGRYDVKVKIGDEVQYTAHTELPARFMQTIDLKHFHPTTLPATAPAGTAFP